MSSGAAVPDPRPSDARLRANVARMHALLGGLTAEECRKLNYVQVDGEWHYNHWYALIGATRM